MMEKIMKAVKSSNKRRGRNITIGVIVGYILAGGIVYSKEISLKKKAVYDEEIKWLWPFEKGNGTKKLDGNTGGEELPPESEEIPPKKDEIPWEHDPDGIVEDGLEQDSIDKYTEILKREWNKEAKKWEIVGLQDESEDGIADIYDLDGDFDGDGIKNKDDKNWALNDEKQNDHFMPSNGLGYVDSGNIIKIVKGTDWNTDEIEEYLYHDNKKVFNEGLKGLSENIQFKKINDLKEYNKNHNSKETIDSEEEIKEKLKMLGEEHINNYKKTPEGDSLVKITKFNNYSDISDSQIIETKTNGKSLDSAILINKGIIEGNKKTPQASGFIRTGQIVQANRNVKIEESELINYGIIKTATDYDNSFYGQQGGTSNSELINYGAILLEVKSNSNTGDYGGIGQSLGTRGDIAGKWKAYNYGIIKISNKSGGVTIGQETVNNQNNSGKSENELYNYGKILLHSYGDLNTSGSVTDWGESNSNVGQQLILQNAEETIGKIYNYNKIELTDKVLKNTGDEVWRYNYGQYAGGYSDSNSIKYEVYNYGEIKINSTIEGDKIKENYSYGQYGFLNGSNSKSSIFNYGILKILENSEGINSYGQFLNIHENTISIEKNEMYNYGKIEVNGKNETIGQFIRTWSNNGYLNSFMNNYGVIKSEGKGLVAGQFIRGDKGTANNYGLIRVKGVTSDTAGMKITDGASSCQNIYLLIKK